jgi:hypothetical protein
LKANEELRIDYKKVGRSYEMQRQFRAKWAMQAFEAEITVKKVVEKSSESEHLVGEHMSLSKIIWEEKNRTAGVNYMM